MKCNACLNDVHADLIADASSYDTGGDTICLACHADCLPEDADRCASKALAWVESQGDDGPTDADAEVAFRAIYRREADATDRAEGLWSHCCAALS